MSGLTKSSNSSSKACRWVNPLVGNTILQGAYVATQELLALRGSSSARASRRRARVRQGEQLSRVRGRGMDFAEVRAYQPGDDVRTIDWRVTARRNKPHTKVFQEERERPTLIVVDQTRPLFFGSRVRLKSVAAAEIASRLAWQCLANNDRVGGIVVGNDALAVHRPLRSARAVARLLNDIAVSNQQLNATTPLAQSMRAALPQVAQLARSGHRIYLVTDCFALDNLDRQRLLKLSRHNEVHCYFVFDPLERELPPANRYRVKDQNESLQFHSGNKALRNDYRARFDARLETLESLCRETRITHHRVATTQPWGK